MPAFSARLPLVTALLLAVAMVATLAWQGYRFWEQEQAPNNQPAATQPARAETPRAQRQPQVSLASIDMFGRADPEALAGDQDTEDLPETNLRLFLRGVLAGTEEQPGSALIEDDRNRTEVYIIGDELPGNARLRSVHANRIIIERGGKLENLYFPETDDSRGMELAATDNGPQSTQSADEGMGTDQPRAMATPQATDERRQQIRQRLEELRQRLKDQ